MSSKLIRGNSEEEWTAVLGSEDRSQRKVSLPIEEIFIHPKFANYQNDIGKVHRAKLTHKVDIFKFAAAVRKRAMSALESAFV